MGPRSADISNSFRRICMMISPDLHDTVQQQYELIKVGKNGLLSQLDKSSTDLCQVGRKLYSSRKVY